CSATRIASTFAPTIAPAAHVAHLVLRDAETGGAGRHRDRGSPRRSLCLAAQVAASASTRSKLRWSAASTGRRVTQNSSPRTRAPLISLTRPTTGTTGQMRLDRGLSEFTQPPQVPPSFGRRTTRGPRLTAVPAWRTRSLL